MAIAIEEWRRTVIIGNSGSGKSWLAHEITAHSETPVFDLDTIHWQGETYGTRRPENEARRLVAELAAKSSWVIEGVYGWLARIALPHASALLWIDLPWEACRAGLLARGLRRGMSESDHAALLAWAGEYWTRQNANSYGGHLRLFESFGGGRARLKTRSEIDQLLSTLAHSRQ
jgi:adenylate kinase family enzyme